MKYVVILITNRRVYLTFYLYDFYITFIKLGASPLRGVGVAPGSLFPLGLASGETAFGTLHLPRAQQEPHQDMFFTVNIVIPTSMSGLMRNLFRPWNMFLLTFGCRIDIEQ